MILEGEFLALLVLSNKQHNIACPRRTATNRSSSSAWAVLLFLPLASTGKPLKLYRYIRRTYYCGMGVLMYGCTGYCLPLLHLRHQHVSICPDVDVRTVTLHIRDSKLNANLCVTLSKCDDAPKYKRTQQMLEILRAGRAYGNSRIQCTTIFKICKHDSTRYPCDSISKLTNWGTMLYLSSTLSPTFYTLRIQKDTSFIHFHVQNYTKCICTHKLHKVQVKDSFLL